VTGDLALYHGATAGMFIAGGIAPRLIRFIDENRFRARMEAKAPMVGLVASIPSRIITHPHAALIGAAHALSAHELSARN
jgi:glucokinase